MAKPLGTVSGLFGIGRAPAPEEPEEEGGILKTLSDWLGMEKPPKVQLPDLLPGGRAYVETLRGVGKVVGPYVPEWAKEPIVDQLGAREAYDAALQSPFMAPGARAIGGMIGGLTPVDIALLGTAAVGDAPGAIGAGARVAGAGLSALDMAAGASQVAEGRDLEGAIRTAGAGLGGVLDIVKPGMGFFSPEEVVETGGRATSRAARDLLDDQTRYARDLAELNAPAKGGGVPAGIGEQSRAAVEARVWRLAQPEQLPTSGGLVSDPRVGGRFVADQPETANWWSGNVSGESTVNLDEFVVSHRAQDPVRQAAEYAARVTHEMAHTQGRHALDPIGDSAGVFPSQYTGRMTEQLAQDTAFDELVQQAKNTPLVDWLEDIKVFFREAGDQEASSWLERYTNQLRAAPPEESAVLQKAFADILDAKVHYERTTYFGGMDPAVKSGQRDLARPWAGSVETVEGGKVVPRRVDELPDYIWEDQQKELSKLILDRNKPQPEASVLDMPANIPEGRHGGGPRFEQIDPQQVTQFGPESIQAIKRAVRQKLLSEGAATREADEALKSLREQAFLRVQKDPGAGATIFDIPHQRQPQEALTVGLKDATDDQVRNTLKQLVDDSLPRDMNAANLKSAIDQIFTPGHSSLTDGDRDAIRAFIGSLTKNGKVKPPRQWHIPMMIINTMRSIRASTDLSFLLRQGLPFTVNHPIKAAKLFFDVTKNQVWKTIADPTAAKALMQAHDVWLQSKSIREAVEEYGLNLSHSLSDADALRGSVFDAAQSGRLGKTMEDILLGEGPGATAAGAIPRLIEGSNRAYRVFLDRARYSMFESLTGHLPTAKLMDIDKAKEIAAGIVNITTGAGNVKQIATGKLGKVSGAATESMLKRFLSYGLFSPSFTAARLQGMNPATYLRLMGSAEGRAAGAVGARYLVGQALAPLTVVSTLAAMGLGKVEFGEPGSADWLKLKLPSGVRLDVFAGQQQTARLAWAFYKVLEAAAGQGDGPYKINTSTGQFQEQTAKDYLGTFLENRTSPQMTALLEFLEGKSPWKAVAAQFVPFTVEDAAEAGVGGTVASVVGAGAYQGPKGEADIERGRILWEAGAEGRKARKEMREEGYYGPQRKPKRLSEVLKQTRKRSKRANFEAQIVGMLREGNIAGARSLARRANRRYGYEFDIRAMQRGLR